MFGLRWTHPDNVFLAGFGEHETSRPVCQRLLDLPFCVNRRKTQYNAILGKWEAADGDDGQYFCHCFAQSLARILTLLDCFISSNRRRPRFMHVRVDSTWSKLRS
jgi:hypothetical protein